MIPSGSPSPVGGAQPVATSLMRTNSSLLGGAYNSSIPSQSPFSALQSPRVQFNANEFLSNFSNVSSHLNHSLGNGLAATCRGHAVPPVYLQHQGSIIGGDAEFAAHAETNIKTFSSSSGSMQGQQFQKPSGNQHCLDHLESQQYDGMQNFQQQLSVAHCQHQKFLRGCGSMNSVPPLNLESKMVSEDLNWSAQQLHALRNMGAMRMEQHQQLHSLTNLAPVKTEHQHSDPTMILPRQQTPFLQISKQPSQAAVQMALLQQQQRIFQQQQQQQQQQQVVNAMPCQGSQFQQQLHQQSPPVRPQVKPSGYEPGACARRLTNYIYQQRHRPEDNNIEFWRKFVLDFFAPNAKKRWCVSLYGNGRQTTGVFPQDVWHCEICSRKPGRGFETTVEVLPRLCQIKYASGTLEEFLYVDFPHEYLNASGQIVLDYAKAIQESVFDQLRVVRDGQLRIIFNQDLKIASWEFCARHHEELIPRKLILPPVSQLGAVLQKHTAQNSSNISALDLQNTCNSFIASARHLAKSLEVPLVNDLGYTKRYVRCLQISEVVNSMKDLIDYSKENGTGPMDSLVNFPRERNASSELSSQQAQPLKDQQNLGQNLYQSNQNCSHPTSMHIAPSIATADTGNSGVGVSMSTSTTSINGILLQNSMISSKPENQMSTVSSSYCSLNTVQMPSASSFSSQQSQVYQSSPFFPSIPHNHPTPTFQFSSSNSYTSLSSSIEQTANQSHRLTNPNDSQSSVQQILQDIMLTPHSNSINSLTHDLKGINGIAHAALSGGNCLADNAIVNYSGTGKDFGKMCCDITPTVSATGFRTAINNNALSFTGKVGINHVSHNITSMNHQLHQDLGSFGVVNGFNSLQFD